MYPFVPKTAILQLLKKRMYNKKVIKDNKRKLRDVHNVFTCRSLKNCFSSVDEANEERYPLINDFSNMDNLVQNKSKPLRTL